MDEQAQQSGSILELHLAASAKQVEEDWQHNRSILLSCYDPLTCMYYLTKYRIFKLQVENGDDLLKLRKQSKEGRKNVSGTICN